MLSDDVGRRSSSASSLAQLVDVGALLADHHARARGIDRDAALLVRTLDHDPARRRPASAPSCSISRILMSSCSSLPYSSLPANQRRVPGAVDAEAQADRIDFLTHRTASSALASASTSTNHDRQVARTASRCGRRGHGRAALKALHHDAPCRHGPRRRPDRRRRDRGCSRHWRSRDSSAFLHVDRDPLARELQVGERRLRPSCRGSAAATRFSFCGLTRSMRGDRPWPRCPASAARCFRLAHA